MEKRQRFRKYLRKNKARIIKAALASLVPLILFSYNLGGHSRGILPDERLTIAASSTVSDVFAAPSYLPYRAGVFMMTKLGLERIEFYRMISVIIALLSVWAFYSIIRRWYTRRIALLGTLLFCSSSIVLHAARTAVPDVMQLSVLMTMSVGLWLRRTKYKRLALYAFLGALAMTIYVPGLIWVAIALLWFRGGQLVRLIGKQTLVMKLMLLSLTLLILAPGVLASVLHPRELLGVLGLPDQVHSASIYFENAKNTIGGLLWRFNTAPWLWTPGTPILDIVTLVMAILGVYSLRFEKGLIRTQIQLSLFGLYLVLILLLGPVTMLALAPPVYLLATGGFAFMLQQWFAVFPHNPFARTIAITGMIGLLSGVVVYQSYRYFTVWPNHPEVRVVLSDQYLVK